MECNELTVRYNIYLSSFHGYAKMAMELSYCLYRTDYIFRIKKINCIGYLHCCVCLTVRRSLSIVVSSKRHLIDSYKISDEILLLVISFVFTAQSAVWTNEIDSLRQTGFTGVGFGSAYVTSNITRFTDNTNMYLGAIITDGQDYFL